ELEDLWLEGLPLANLAQLEQEAQRFDAASQLLREAITRFRATSERQYVSVYSAVIGDLCSERGMLEEARRGDAEAESFFRGWVGNRVTSLLYAAWAALEARLGDATRADELLALARRSGEKGETPIVRLALEAHEGHVLLRRAGDAGGESARAQ